MSVVTANHGRTVQRSFDHMLKRHPRRNYKGKFDSKFLAIKDRIPLWNYSAGDRVRVITGVHKGKFGTIDYVNRQSNHVCLVEPEFQRRRDIGGLEKGAIFNSSSYSFGATSFGPTKIHYSNLQLVMQKTPEQEAAFELARENPSDPLPELVATRLRAAGASYAWRLHRYAWRRKAEHAVAIDPATGYSYSQTVQPEQSYIKHLDMPKATPKRPAPSLTTSDAAHEATFVPFENAEEGKMRDLEFFNKHGRARRTRRWNLAKAAADEAAEKEKVDAARIARMRHNLRTRPKAFSRSMEQRRQ